MESSDLSFIADTPENPMQLFASWHNEAKQNNDPELFTDAMTIANISEYAYWKKLIFLSFDFVQQRKIEKKFGSEFFFISFWTLYSIEM